MGAATQRLRRAILFVHPFPRNSVSRCLPVTAGTGMNCMLGSPKASGGLGIHGALKSGLSAGLGAACVMARRLPAGTRAGKRAWSQLTAQHTM